MPETYSYKKYLEEQISLTNPTLLTFVSLQKFNSNDCKK